MDGVGRKGIGRVTGLALVLVLALGAGACAPLPTVRTFDPFTATEQEVDIALAQVAMSCLPSS